MKYAIFNMSINYLMSVEKTDAGSNMFGYFIHIDKQGNLLLWHKYEKITYCNWLSDYAEEKDATALSSYPLTIFTLFLRH